MSNIAVPAPITRVETIFNDNFIKTELKNVLVVKTDMFSVQHIDYFLAIFREVSDDLSDESKDYSNINYNSNRCIITVESDKNIQKYHQAAIQAMKNIEGDSKDIFVMRQANIDIEFLKMKDIEWSGVYAVCDNTRTIHRFRLSQLDTSMYTPRNIKRKSLILNDRMNYHQNFTFKNRCTIIIYAIRGWIEKKNGNTPIVDMFVLYVEKRNGTLHKSVKKFIKTFFPTDSFEMVIGGGYRNQAMIAECNSIVDILRGFYDGIPSDKNPNLIKLDEQSKFDEEENDEFDDKVKISEITADKSSKKKKKEVKNKEPVVEMDRQDEQPEDEPVTTEESNYDDSYCPNENEDEPADEGVGDDEETQDEAENQEDEIEIDISEEN